MGFSVSSRPQSQEMRHRQSPQPSGRLSVPHNSRGNLIGKRKVGVGEQLTRLSPLSPCTSGHSHSSPWMPSLPFPVAWEETETCHAVGSLLIPVVRLLAQSPFSDPNPQRHPCRVPQNLECVTFHGHRDSAGGIERGGLKIEVILDYPEGPMSPQRP